MTSYMPSHLTKNKKLHRYKIYVKHIYLKLSSPRLSSKTAAPRSVERASISRAIQQSFTPLLARSTAAQRSVRRRPSGGQQSSSVYSNRKIYSPVQGRVTDTPPMPNLTLCRPYRNFCSFRRCKVLRRDVRCRLEALPGDRAYLP